VELSRSLRSLSSFSGAKIVKQSQRLSAQETQVLLLLGNGKTRAEIAKELSAVTFLKAAGVSNALAMEIIGHESAAISRGYTHVSADDLRREMAKLPEG
jgi:FixJ family two-component response regulator